MTLPRFKLQPGQSIFDQVVFAAVKAFISGDYEPGQAFPSVRALAADLKINPNTAHKIVAHLTSEGLLQVQPGIGTVVQKPPRASSEDKSALLKEDLERLVVEAKGLSITLSEITRALEQHWEKIS